MVSDWFNYNGNQGKGCVEARNGQGRQQLFLLPESKKEPAVFDRFFPLVKLDG